MNNSSSNSNAHSEATLQARLQALPEMIPTEDRLAAVLAQVATHRAGKAAQQAPSAANKPRPWLIVLAAAICAIALLMRVSDLRLTRSNQAESEITLLSAEQQEIALLRSQSQALERQLQLLRDDRASLSQLDALSVAELSLAALDAQLQSESRPSSEDVINQQRALWRERVAVLQAVNQGHYQPTLYAID